MIPWNKDGGQWQIASCDQFRFEKQRRVIEGKLGPVTMVWASRAQIQAHQEQLFEAQLAHHSEVCVPREQSCRSLGFTSLHKGVRWAVMAGLAALVFFLITLNAAHPFFIPGVLLMACNLTTSRFAMCSIAHCASGAKRRSFSPQHISAGRELLPATSSILV